MNEPCMCGADDCPRCYPDQPEVEREWEADDMYDFSCDGVDPTMGSGYTEPHNWP